MLMREGLGMVTDRHDAAMRAALAAAFAADVSERWVCGDCGYKPPKSNVGKDGPRNPTCPKCRGDFRWVLAREFGEPTHVHGESCIYTYPDCEDQP